MGSLLLLVLLGEGARPDLPRPKPEIRHAALSPVTAPAPRMLIQGVVGKPKRESAAERRRRLAEAKRSTRILRALAGRGLLGQLSGAPTATDDREAIHRVIEAHKGAVRYCYEKELARKPDLGGRVVTRFAIDATGAVTDASVSESTLADAAVEGCLLRQLRSWRFPAQATSVSYPFRFENGG